MNEVVFLSGKSAGRDMNGYAFDTRSATRNSSIIFLWVKTPLHRQTRTEEPSVHRELIEAGTQISFYG